jgi:hypothetical protein
VCGVFGIMATKLLTVDSLPVAKRWQKKMRETYHELHHPKIGIWEKPRQTTSNYSTSGGCRYVVGHSASVEYKVNHLGKRIA